MDTFNQLIIIFYNKESEKTKIIDANVQSLKASCMSLETEHNLAKNKLTEDLKSDVIASRIKDLNQIDDRLNIVKGSLETLTQISSLDKQEKRDIIFEIATQLRFVVSELNELESKLNPNYKRIDVINGNPDVSKILTSLSISPNLRLTFN